MERFLVLFAALETRRISLYIGVGSHTREGIPKGFSVPIGLPIRNVMDESTYNSEAISIPRWTFKRDVRSGCMFCCSIVVCVTTETSQMAFCCCRLMECPLLLRPNVRKANTGRH